MEKLYTVVNQETCISCGSCGACAPDIFDYDGERKAFVHIDGNRGTALIEDEDMLFDLEDALDGCPTDSIKTGVEPIVTADAGSY
ncbi:ferredoxin [Salinicoccus sediminis]|uniref:Ferredoxin n=1 Tax=Salinicoccus sediminis TaxID=1432562 RepID=A0A0M2SS33_9STAP|nr:ferredoxin [Salinicoccus sediminis]KKK35792.1 ferredoxin [Salinicoccus sediminis]